MLVGLSIVIREKGYFRENYRDLKLLDQIVKIGDAVLFKAGTWSCRFHLYLERVVRLILIQKEGFVLAIFRFEESFLTIY